MNTKLKVNVGKNGRLPSKAYADDFGYDLYAAENTVIRPGETIKVSTDISIQLPDGCGGLIKDRSSLGSKSLHVFGGVIDNGYRGEIKVCLHNARQGGEQETFIITKGDKIAQLLIMPSVNFEVEEGELDEAHRGEKGFGSSGR